ncbi:MAG: hypothetical protein PVI59_11825 [Anaerolineae bacterium]|jgi:hypothetical protein
MDEAGFIVRFRREAQAGVALQQAKIVQALDFDVERVLILTAIVWSVGLTWLALLLQ